MRKFPEFHVTNSFIERLTSQFARVHDKSQKICHVQRLAVVSKLLQSRPEDGGIQARLARSCVMHILFLYIKC